MRFHCTLCGVVIAVLSYSPAPAQDSTPSPTTVMRSRWPDGLLLRGPGAQIGASFRDLKPAEAQHISLVLDGGVVIEQVRAGSPASRAGLMKGDRVTLFDGQRVRNAKEFAQLVEETPPGRTVNITIVREGQVRKLPITPAL
jgi:S1-C subfamily serine protease